MRDVCIVAVYSKECCVCRCWCNVQWGVCRCFGVWQGVSVHDPSHSEDCICRCFMIKLYSHCGSWHKTSTLECPQLHFVLSLHFQSLPFNWHIFLWRSVIKWFYHVSVHYGVWHCHLYKIAAHPHTHTQTHVSRLMAFFQENPGRPVPGINYYGFCWSRDIMGWHWHQLDHVPIR